MNVEIKDLCNKLTHGSKNSRGRNFKANKHHNYVVYAEYMEKEAMRPLTIKDYMKWLNKVQCDINETTIPEWKQYIHVPDKPLSTKTRERMIYMTYVALQLYIKSINKREWLHLLPHTSEVPKPSTTLRYKGVDKIIWRTLINGIRYDKIRKATILMRNLGLRVSEICQLRKNWICELEFGWLSPYPAR